MVKTIKSCRLIFQEEDRPKLIKGAKELFYPGLPHGLTATNADQVNADLPEIPEVGQQVRRAAA